MLTFAPKAWRGPTRSLVAAFALTLSLPTAFAQASIDECEKIQAADAYNQCLAKFGPTSKVKSVEPEKPGDMKNSSAEAIASSGSARHGHRASRHASLRRGRGGHSSGRHASGGRKHMSFSVKKHH